MIIISVSYVLLGMLFTAIYLKLISVLRIDIDDWSCEYPPYGIFFAFWIVLALPIISFSRFIISICNITAYK